MGKNTRFNKNKKKAKNTEKCKAVKHRIKTHKQQINFKIAKQFVLNLSSKKLSQPQTMVLAKGLNFVPTTNISKNQILRDFKRTERSFRLSYFFLENSNIKIKNHPFKDKSKFSVPNYTDNQIEKYIFYMKMELSNYRPKKNSIILHTKKDGI